MNDAEALRLGAASRVPSDTSDLPPEGEPINDKLMRLFNDYCARRRMLERHLILRDVDWTPTDKSLLDDALKQFSVARQEARAYESVARGYTKARVPSESPATEQSRGAKGS